MSSEEYVKAAINNPHPVFSLGWFAWKEEHDNYRPYHVGTTPAGGYCPVRPRVVLVEPGVYRCPACGKRFPTAMAELASLALSVPASGSSTS